MATPLIYLSATEYISGVWLDKSGNGKHATIEDGTATKNSDGNGLVLDGQTSWTFPNVAAGNTWTANVWYKQTGTNVGTNACILTQTTGAMNLMIGILDDVYRTSFYNNGYQSGNIITFNGWTNVQSTWDGTNMKTYINGTLLGSTSLYSASTDSETPYRIGRRWDISDYVVGEIGEVRIYNVALTASQVAVDYNSSCATFSASPIEVPPEPTRLVFLSASDYTSGAWVDKSGNGKNATLAQGSIAKNSSGNGIVLDGQTFWTLPALELTEWTVGVWFKETAPPQPGGCIITQIFQPDSINLLIGDSDRNSSYRAGFYNNGFLASPSITMNGWTNIQASYNGTSLTTYVNGVLISSFEGVSVNSGQGYRIGRCWDVAAYVTGEIGEVRIYNFPLTQAQVTADYDESASTFAALAPTDLGYSRDGLKLLLYWTPVAQVQFYTIESSEKIGNIYGQYQPMDTSQRSNFLTPDLVIGSTYKFRVSAVYEDGSEGVEISDIVIVTFPGAPLNVRYENTPTVNSITLIWDTPAYNGGSEIEHYAVALYADTEVIYTTAHPVGINRVEYTSVLPLNKDIKFVINTVNSIHYSVEAQSSVVRFDSLISVQDVTEIKNTFNNVITGEAATAAINTLIGNKPEIAIVAAVLANASPVMFTALVSNPAFIGKSVSIPSSIAATLYSNFADKSSLNTSLPLKINFPDVDGVTPPARGSNSKLAIDLTVDAYVSFKGCSGYGIHVVAGEQYFTTPSNSIGTLVHVGDIITFTTDAGITINSKVADLDIVLIPYTAPSVICFLGSAPILTPNGYCRIDSLVVGDLVSTPSGTSVIDKIEKQVYMPSIDTNPYIIPEGRFGSNSRILISPRHKVCVDGVMIEARDLELLQEEQYEKITYYNIQVMNYENIIVAGLEVESLQPLVRINIPLETFNYIIENKYGGNITDEIKQRCYLMNDGTVSVPMIL